MCACACACVFVHKSPLPRFHFAAVAARAKQLEEQYQRDHEQYLIKIKDLADVIKSKEDLIGQLSKKEEHSQQLQRQYEKRIEVALLRPAFVRSAQVSSRADL